MIASITRKSINLLYSMYSPIRRYRAQNVMRIKKSQGFNNEYTKNSIPISEIPNKLNDAGINRGDTVFMRCSTSAAQAFNGGPIAFLKELIKYLTPDGTLVMDAYTFDKSPIMYLAKNPVFDARKTIAKVSLISELFRRIPGVKRSIHPTHSLCAIGKNADWILSDHHTSSFCYDIDSPVARLINLKAKEVSIGVYPTSLIFHYIEQFCPEGAPIYSDLKTPLMCRVVIDEHEEIRPFKVTDHFAVYHGNYEVFKGTEAEPQRFFFGDYLDFYTCDLSDRNDAMKDLISQGRYWLYNKHKILNMFMKHVVKPIMIYAYFNEVDGKLYPIEKGKK